MPCIYLRRRRQNRGRSKSKSVNANLIARRLPLRRERRPPPPSFGIPQISGSSKVKSRSILASRAGMSLASQSNTQGRSRPSWEWESAGVRTHPCQLLRVAYSPSMRRFANSAARSDSGPDRPHLRMPTGSNRYAQMECPAKRTQNGVDHPIRHRQAGEGDRDWLGCRGTGTMGIFPARPELVVPFQGQWAA